MIATIDFETTGLKAGEDEVLQVSIIDENYNVLLNVYCRPNNKEEWGAEPGTEYYTLHIHEIRERKDC